MTFQSNDIYAQMTSILSDITIDDSKKDSETELTMIKDSLKKYTIFKMLRYGSNCNILNDMFNHYDLKMLFDFIDQAIINEKIKNDFFEHYVSYLLNVISVRQDHPVEWWMEGQPVYLGNPQFEENGDLLEGLHTYDNEKMYDVLLYVLNEFDDKYLKASSKNSYQKKIGQGGKHDQC